MEENDYSWLNYLPDNYTNSGRILGGYIPIETAKELLVIFLGCYVLTAAFLQPVVSPNVLWGVRLGIFIFTISTNLLVKVAFHSSVLNFLLSFYEYVKFTKRYRYERRDKAYVQRKNAQKKKSTEK